MLTRLGAAALWFAVARYRGRGSHIRPSRPVWIASPLCADLICDRHNRHPLHPAVPFAAQHGARPKLRSTPAQVRGACPLSRETPAIKQPLTLAIPIAEVIRLKPIGENTKEKVARQPPRWKPARLCPLSTGDLRKVDRRKLSIVVNNAQYLASFNLFTSPRC